MISHVYRQLATGRPPDVKFTREQRLVIDAIRQVFGTPDSSTMGAAPEQSLDWDQAAKLIFAEGLAPIVYSGLETAHRLVPESVQAILRTGYLAAQVRTNAWIVPAFCRAMDVLGGLKIEPLVLKGMALAYSAYPRPSQRTMADIDLLLPPGDIQRAREALCESGFTVEPTDMPVAHHVRPLYWDRGQVSVELHRQLFPGPGPLTLDLESFQVRARVEEVAGLWARVLAPADALLHTCIHLSYHHHYRWFPLRSLMDILAITTRNADALDWDLFLMTAVASQMTGAVYWPLRLAHEWIGALIPESVLAQLAPEPFVHKLIEAALEPRYLLDSGLATWSSDAVLRSSLLELSLYSGRGARAQIASVLRSLFPPPHAVGHLPPSLTRSPVRYTLYLANPIRMTRGLFAFARLLGRAY